MLHLDTNFLVRALQPGTAEEGLLRGWIGSNETLGISAVAWAEFHCGPLDAGGRMLARTLFPEVEPLLPADAEKGAELFNLTGRRSRSLADCLIAAIALRCGAQLATGNRQHFLPLVPYGVRLA